MYRIAVHFILILLFISNSSFVNASLIEPTESIVANAKINNLIGFEYNLWGVKAENKKGASEYKYTGRIFLDKRKGYKASYEEDEHFFFFKEKFSNGEIFEIPGSKEVTRFVNKKSAREYYVALKFGPQWKHHQLRDILENYDTSVGSNVGCENCNFSKSYYDLETDWALTVYYEIKPIFRESDLSNGEMVQQILEELKAKKGFGETVASEEIAVADVEERVIDQTDDVTPPMVEREVSQESEIPETKSIVTKPTIVEKVTPSFSATEIPEIVNQNVTSYHVLFRVLNDPNQTFDDLVHLGPLYKETFDENGSTRYLIGNSSSIEEAKELERKVAEAGYNSTILADYRNGKLREYVDRTREPSAVVVSEGNSPTGYGRPIQFTAIGKGDKSFNKLTHLGEVYSEKVDGRDLYRYKLRPYGHLNIQSVVAEVKQLGFKGAFVTD